MRVVTFRGEKSVSAIAKKVYGDLTGKARKAAEAALRKANPQLETIRDVRPGTLLRVPELPDLQPRAGRGLEDPVSEIVAVLAQSLDDYVRRHEERHKLYQTELKNQAALLNDQDLNEAIRGVPAVETLAADIAEQLDTRSREAEAGFKRLVAAVEKLKAELP